MVGGGAQSSCSPPGSARRLETRSHRHQDHRQRAHRAPDGRQHRPRRQRIMDETETLDQVADRLFDEVLAVASARQTAAETSAIVSSRSTAQSHDLTPAVDFTAIALEAASMRETSMPRTARRSATAAAARVATSGGSSARCCSSRHHQLHRSAGHRHSEPTLQQQFGWSEIDYADIVFSFQLAYAIGLLLAGGIVDALARGAGSSWRL